MGTDKSGLGDYEGNDYIVYTETKGATIIAKGAVCDRAAGGEWRTCPTSGGTAPFGVAVKSKTAAELDLPILTEGTVIVRADGAIKKGAYVIPSATTAGEVIEYAASSAGGTPSQSDVNNAGANWRSVVGRYIGKPGQIGPGELPTDAVDGDLITIRLGSR